MVSTFYLPTSSVSLAPIVLVCPVLALHLPTLLVSTVGTGISVGELPTAANKGRCLGSRLMIRGHLISSPIRYYGNDSSPQSARVAVQSSPVRYGARNGPGSFRD